MRKNILISFVLGTLAVCGVTSVNAEWSAELTFSEIHQSLIDAENSENPLGTLLAKKVYEVMEEQDVRFVNDAIEYTPAPVFPAWRAGFEGYNSDPTRDNLFNVINGLSPVKTTGRCDIPLPGYSLLAVEGSSVGFSGRLSKDDSGLFLNSSPNTVQVGVYASGILESDAALRLAWGGSYIVPGFEYRCDIPVPPYGCGDWYSPKICTTICGYAPTAEMRCEQWKDSAGLKVQADVSASVVATLDTSYSVTDKTITLSKNLRLTGDIYIKGGNSDVPDGVLPNRLIPYVSPDFGSISSPSLSSPISAQILAQVVALPVVAVGVVLGPFASDPIVNILASTTSGALVGLSIAGYEQKWVKEQYQEYLSEQNAEFDAKGYNSPIIIKLPDDVDGELLKMVIEFLNERGITSYIVSFVRDNLHEILYYLMTDDQEALSALFTSAAACEALKEIVVPMSVVPLYSDASGGCVEIDVNGPDVGSYYTDVQCTNEVAYRPTPNHEYCKLAMAGTPNELIGNANSWIPDLNQVNDVAPGTPSRKWTQWLGTQLPLSAESISSNSSPYMKQVRYRDVSGDRQSEVCALEMRVFKKDITSQNRPALIALHGGSWTYRGAGYNALETTISHYTERGFVVFAPFYRLVGDNDANPECNGAQWSEVVSDAEAAVDWVIDYGPAYGAKLGKVAVTGQSAGAHLSQWLITHRPDDISAGLLHYAPLDVHDFISNAYVGGIYEEWIPSLSILSEFFGTDVSQVDVNNPPYYVTQNSFAKLVRESDRRLPDAFMLYGVADSIVPSNQAVELCNAYGGAAVNDGGGSSLREIYSCGDFGGELHLFEEGQHGLDACVNSFLCLSGSSESADLVAESSKIGRDWLYARTELPTVLPVVNIASSKQGGGAANTTDGNTGSVWVAKNGDYLQADLGVPRLVGAVGVIFAADEQIDSATTVSIETSLNQDTWTEVFRGGPISNAGVTTGVSWTNSRDIALLDFLVQDARYVRIAADGGDKKGTIRVAEVRLYGPATPSYIPFTNVVTDNVEQLGARWNRYDFGALYEVAHVVFLQPPGNGVEIQFLDRDRNWITPVPTNDVSGSVRVFDFNEVVASAIRINVPQNVSGSGGIQFNVYGTKVSSDISTSPGSTGGGGGAIGWMLVLFALLMLAYNQQRVKEKFPLRKLRIVINS